LKNFSASGVCALYHRVSTEGQDLEGAADELGRAAAMRGLTVGMMVEETGSGATNDRPGLQSILAAAREGLIGWVLVVKLDRWGRSAQDVLANVDKLRRSGVRFVAVSQGLEVGPRSDLTSDLILTVLAAVAEFERGLIVERTKAGLAAARARGVRLGRPVAANTVKIARVLELRAAGYSFMQISRDVRLSPETCRKILTQENQETEGGKQVRSRALGKGSP
jgi:putative DNA-invertase from lambdoid prophage Rac